MRVPRRPQPPYASIYLYTSIPLYLYILPILIPYYILTHGAEVGWPYGSIHPIPHLIPYPIPYPETPGQELRPSS